MRASSRSPRAASAGVHRERGAPTQRLGPRAQAEEPRRGAGDERRHGHVGEARAPLEQRHVGGLERVVDDDGAVRLPAVAPERARVERRVEPRGRRALAPREVRREVGDRAIEDLDADVLLEARALDDER